ncbi:Smr/MutS family protein [Mycoplasmopsis cynos]|nr:Smr/MutS family protein [Mycoplasmopsis cynos]
MRIEVDLYGLESQEALIKIQEYVFDLLENRYQKIIFITGNGSGALKTTLENFINNHNKHSMIKWFLKEMLTIFLMSESRNLKNKKSP